VAYSTVISSDTSLLLKVVAVDFSYYEGAMGIGVAVYEGNLRHILRQSFILSQASHTLAEKCVSRECIKKSIKTALYGLHRREFELEDVYEFLDLLNYMCLKVSQLIATNYVSKVVSSIEQWSSNNIIVLIHDTPGVHRDRKRGYIESEESILQEIKSVLKRKGLTDIYEIVGKNYFVILSDIVAYIAALNKHLMSKEDREIEEKRNRLVELLKPFNLILL